MREGWSGNDEQADRQDDERTQPEFHCVTSSQPLASLTRYSCEGFLARKLKISDQRLITAPIA